MANGPIDFDTATEVAVDCIDAVFGGRLALAPAIKNLRADRNGIVQRDEHFRDALRIIDHWRTLLEKATAAITRPVLRAIAVAVAKQKRDIPPAEVSTMRAATWHELALEALHWVAKSTRIADARRHEREDEYWQHVLAFAWELELPDPRTYVAYLELESAAAKAAAATNPEAEAAPAEPPQKPMKPGAAAADSKSKGVAPRNAWFLEQYEAQGSDTYHKPAKIQNKWWRMTDKERAAICPDSPGKATPVTVVQGIKLARQQRDGKKTKAKSKGKRAASKK